MTKTVARKRNGVPETMLVSDAKADKMIAKGWQLIGDDKPKKRGPKPKAAPVAKAVKAEE